MNFTVKNYNGGLSVVQQVAISIVKDIEAGHFKQGEKLLSVNVYSKQYKVARDTITKAYEKLKKDGVVISVAGRGYFVQKPVNTKIKILVLFNTLNSFKKAIYDAMANVLGDHAKIDLYVYHYNPVLLNEIIEQNLFNYHYYVIMPHFYHNSDENEYLFPIQKIPSHQLVFIDKNLKQINARSAVFQDFQNDVYDSMSILSKLLLKYQALTVICPSACPYPAEIQYGIVRYCEEHSIRVDFKNKFSADLSSKTAYFIIDDEDLTSFLSSVKESKYVLGKDIGLISFNENVFKDLLDITVISTDFSDMGRKVAGCILNGEDSFLKNSFKTIIRKSL